MTDAELAKRLDRAIQVPSGVSRPTPGEPRDPEHKAPPVSGLKRSLARSILQDKLAAHRERR